MHAARAPYPARRAGMEKKNRIYTYVPILSMTCILHACNLYRYQVDYLVGSTGSLPARPDLASQLMHASQSLSDSTAPAPRLTPVVPIKRISARVSSPTGSSMSPMSPQRRWDAGPVRSDSLGMFWPSRGSRQPKPGSEQRRSKRSQ